MENKGDIRKYLEKKGDMNVMTAIKELQDSENDLQFLIKAQELAYKYNAIYNYYKVNKSLICIFYCTKKEEVKEIYNLLN